jgi:hypothetical protein
MLYLMWTMRKKIEPVDSNGTPIDGFWELDYLGDSSRPRGIRNNNPGNVMMGSSTWQGQVPNSQNSDGRFLQFTKFHYGVRCCTKLVRNYITVHNRNTIRKIIERYAPAAENGAATANYIAFVALKSGYLPDQTIEPNKEHLSKIIPAMCQFENGQGTNYVTPSMVEAIWDTI